MGSKGDKGIQYTVPINNKSRVCMSVCMHVSMYKYVYVITCVCVCVCVCVYMYCQQEIEEIMV